MSNAIFAKTELVTYSGPHYSTFGQKLYLEYTIDYFKKCLFSDDQIDLHPGRIWSDDPWYRNQDDRRPTSNDGYLTINEGEAEGTILGGNLCTINLLQGTDFMPSLEDTILFLEDDDDSTPEIFDRDLQSLVHQPGFAGVQGIAIGRFQKASRMTDDLLRKIIQSKDALKNMPVIANVDFGHTDPKITFPIGGRARMRADNPSIITVMEH